MLEAAEQMSTVIRYDLQEPFKVIDDGVLKIHLYPEDKDNLAKIDRAVSKLGVAINIDSDKISQVLHHIVSNAVDSIKNTGKIRVKIETSQESVQIYVWNNGEIIKDEEKENIFLTILHN